MVNPAVKLTPGIERMLREVDKARKRRARALKLRRDGKTVQQVADLLRVSKQRASALIQRAVLEERAA